MGNAGGHRMCRIEQAFSQYSAVGRPPWVPGFATWHGKLPCRSNSALFRSMNSRITRGRRNRRSGQRGQP
jgi:hypothetical protein